MANDPVQAPRLGHALVLRSGVCVRLRLVHFSDLLAIRELIARHAAPSDDVAAERLVQFDPRRRYVVCAMALIDRAERLVGLGAIDLASRPAEPEVLIFDPEVGDELPRLLDRALRAAAAATGARAA